MHNGIACTSPSLQGRSPAAVGVALFNQGGCHGAVTIIPAVLAAHGVHVCVAAACVVVPWPDGPSEGPSPGTGGSTLAG